MSPALMDGFFTTNATLELCQHETWDELVRLMPTSMGLRSGLVVVVSLVNFNLLGAYYLPDTVLST